MCSLVQIFIQFLMVQEETDRVKRQIKLSDIKCNREFKNEYREVKSKQLTSMNDHSPNDNVDFHT